MSDSRRVMCLAGCPPNTMPVTVEATSQSHHGIGSSHRGQHHTDESLYAMADLALCSKWAGTTILAMVRHRARKPYPILYTMAIGLSTVFSMRHSGAVRQTCLAVIAHVCTHNDSPKCTLTFTLPTTGRSAFPCACS